MIEIKVNLKFTADEITEKILESSKKALLDLMAVAADEWKREAGQQLHTTKRAYIDAIQTQVISDYEVQIYLQHEDDKDNWLVNALEGGHGPMLPWRSTLAGRKAFYFSPCAKKRPNKYKWGDPFTKKPPFMDVPDYRQMAGEPSSACPKVDSFRRLTPRNATKWTHRGFRPLGQGGLDRPLRHIVAEYLEEQIPKVFSEALKLNKA